MASLRQPSRDGVVPVLAHLPALGLEVPSDGFHGRRQARIAEQQLRQDTDVFGLETGRAHQFAA
ncbi:hypothetical protein SAM9427_36415 (plasmid) [Streptomyces sp. ETH9427]|nr:hypothetical protein SAM9427_36415 [Streptomyces sp. ETH9427]